MQVKEQMAECLKEITVQSLWQLDVSEEEEYYVNEKIVPLNYMVRECYLKYLRQVLTANLNMCSDSSNIFTQHDIERCAGLMELKALRLCMVTSLYQKAMVQMVADIKQHTKESKLYDKLQEFVPQNCLCKINKCKATQTNIFEIKIEDQENVREDKIKHVKIKTEYSDEQDIEHFPTKHVEIPCQSSFSTLPDVNFSESCVSEDFMPVHNSTVHSTNENNILEKNDKYEDKSESNDNTKEVDKCGDDNPKAVEEKRNENLLECCTLNEAMNNYNKNNSDVSSCTLNKPLDNPNKNNSDVSSSSNNAIPSHSCTTSFARSTEEEEAIKQLNMFLNEDTNKSEFGEALLYDTATEELIRILESDDELNEADNLDCKPAEEKRPSKPVECNESSSNTFWKTEKQLQKEKLHDCVSKMCCDPEAKVKIKNKFFDIFGFDSDEEDVWCSKKKIAKYKQRIAPTVVKQLLPYYRQKRILGRHVFKRVASHITDTLVSISHFPEKDDIEKGINLFFSYHGFIGKQDDVWSGWYKELYRK